MGRRRPLGYFIGFLLLCARIAPAQSAGKPEFEAASLKPLGPRSGIGVGGISLSGGPGTRDPGRFVYRGATLRDLVFRAYGLAYGLIDNRQQIAGPAWIDSDRFDLAARVPLGATEEQFQQMLQNLLAERFKLAIYHESKVLQVYELVLGKNGPKLKESPSTPPLDNPTQPANGKLDKDGLPIVPPGYSGMAMQAAPGPTGQIRQNWVFRQRTTAQLAAMLSNFTGQRTVDKTGLTGKFDFNLSFEPQEANSAAGAVPDAPKLTVFDAVEQQVGLKLVDAKDPFDVIVIDRAERTPSAN